METPRIVIPVIILLVGIIGFFVLGEKAGEEKEEAIGLGVPEVEVEEILRHEGTLDINVDGQAIPYEEITLSSEVAGRIVEKTEAVRAGRFVRQGDMLLRIDDRDYRIAVLQLDNELQQAGDSIQELDEEIAGANRLVSFAREQVRLKENKLERQRDLHRNHVSSDAELDQALEEVNNSQNGLATVNNQFDLLKTRRSRLVQVQTLTELKKEKAEYDLGRTTIAAPVSGVIVTDQVEQGDYVTMGTPLVTIEATSAVEVRCNLKMDELSWVWDQPPCRVTFGAVDTPLESDGVAEVGNLETLTGVKSNDAGSAAVDEADIVFLRALAEKKDDADFRVADHHPPLTGDKAIYRWQGKDYAFLRTIAEKKNESNARVTEYHLPLTPVKVIYRMEGKDFYWDGLLWRVDGVGLDERTRTVPCRVIVLQPETVRVLNGDKEPTDGPPALVRGMYVDVQIEVTPSRPLFRVPERAVRPGNEIWLARVLQSPEPTVPDGEVAAGKTDEANDKPPAALLLRVKDGSESSVEHNPEGALQDVNESPAVTHENAAATHELHVVEVNVVGVDDEHAIVSFAEQLEPDDRVIVSLLTIPPSPFEGETAQAQVEE